MKGLVVILIVTTVALSGLFFSNGPKINNGIVFKDTIWTPEEQLAGFKVPEGFVVELVASERDGVMNPVDLSFDDAGRLWTQTAIMYPLDPIVDIGWNDLIRLMDDQKARDNHPAFKRILDLYQGKTKGTDKVLVISGLYDSKTLPKTSIWADGLTLPMSILPYKDGAYVAQGSELFFLNDSDKNGTADERVPMLTGFGFTDTHTMAHVLTRGPGGWIYFSHGALNKGEVTSLSSNVKVNINYSKIARFSMDAKKLELVTAGLNNIWGFQLRNNGQWYGSEANDLGYSVVPMEPGTGFPGIGNDRLREYQPFMPALHNFRVGGTGISGLAFADDASGTFPPEWKDVAFLANPITSTINAVKIVRNPDGTVTASHLPDLLTSGDKYFRPVNMEFGPDGCLYIADWYNKIISHNEIPTTHPDRDKTHGRIFRIRHVSQKPREVPNFYTVKTEELLGYLKSPVLWQKRAAWHQITDRPAAETQQLVAGLVALAGDKKQEENTRIFALWSLEGVKHFDDKLMVSLLSSTGDNLRREAVRSIATFGVTDEQAAVYLGNLIQDPNPMVRSQVLRTLADMGQADASIIAVLIAALKPEIPGNAMGGAYERNFERYLSLKALEEYPKELYSYLNSSKASHQPATNLLWAIQALPTEQKENMFLKIWPTANMRQLDESNFVLVAKMLGNRDIYSQFKPVIQDPVTAAKYLAFSLKNQQQVQSAELSSLLEKPVSQLLKSKADKDKQLALDAAGRMKIRARREAIAAMINDREPPATVKLALKALENNPEANKNIFIKILQNEKLEAELRIASLQVLTKVDSIAALHAVQQWKPAMTDDHKKTLANILSGSKQGTALLIRLYEEKLLPTNSFDLSAAERVHQSALANDAASRIWAEVKKRLEDEKKAFQSRLTKYISLAEKKNGNADKGKSLFQACLMCHRVGDKGLDFAPSLDGSASRENEALLTAILNPDAAVEGGYAVYRVTKKDNSSIEGYLYRKEDRGTTIAFMGGGKTFVEAADIKNQGFLGGRSFMMKGLIDNFKDEQVADLLAYIRTLK